MRYELTDFEWAAIKVVPAEKAVAFRRVLCGFWVLGSGSSL